MPHASGYFRIRYADEARLADTRTRKAVLLSLLLALLALPWITDAFVLDLASQVMLAEIGRAHV